MKIPGQPFCLAGAWSKKKTNYSAEGKARDSFPWDSRAAPSGCLPPPELARYLASIPEKSHNLTEVRVHMANPEEDLACTQIFVTARNAWLVESFGSGPRSSLMAMSHGAGSAKNSSMDRQQI